MSEDIIRSSVKEGVLIGLKQALAIVKLLQEHKYVIDPVKELREVIAKRESEL